MCLSTGVSPSSLWGVLSISWRGVLSFSWWGVPSQVRMWVTHPHLYWMGSPLWDRMGYPTTSPMGLSFPEAEQINEYLLSRWAIYLLRSRRRTFLLLLLLSHGVSIYAHSKTHKQKYIFSLNILLYEVLLWKSIDLSFEIFICHFVKETSENYTAFQ